MCMMTAETRKIRLYDVVADDEATDMGKTDTGSASLGGAATPFNDNARGISARPLPQEGESDGDGFTASAPEGTGPAADGSVHVRRRGPLVTRWIGFAAQRQRAQARVSRMRDRQA